MACSYNRFILNGFRHFTWEPIHIDLLHPSRSVWRNTLTSCRLSHVEEERLGIIERMMCRALLLQRSIFNTWLTEPDPLLGVFQHNETDMLSLACLAIRFGHLLNGDLSIRCPCREHEELLRSGLWLEKMGKIEHAEPLYARFAEDGACL